MNTIPKDLDKRLRKIEKTLCCSLGSGGGGSANILNIGDNDPDPLTLNSIQINNNGDVFFVDGDGNLTEVVGDQAFAALGGNTWDVNLGSKMTKTLTANTAITVNNSVSGVSTMLFAVTQDATGNRTLTINGTVITIRPEPNAKSLVGIVDIGGGTFLYDTNLSGNQGSSVEEILFDVVTNVTRSAGNIYTATASGEFGHYGKSSTKTMTADYMIYAQYTAVGDIFATIGASPDNVDPVNPYYTKNIAGVIVYSGGILHKNDGGGDANLGVTINVGDFFGIKRIGSNYFVIRSVDGIVFNNVATLTVTHSGTDYPIIISYNSGILNNPRFKQL